MLLGCVASFLLAHPCSASSAALESSLARVQELRCTAHYAEAAELASSCLRQLQRDGVTDSRTEDGQRLVDTLQFAAALPDSQQQELSEADRLQGRLEELAWRRDTVAAVVAATRQYSIRRRILGADHLEVVASTATLGRAYHRAGMYAQAEELLRLALQRRRELLPEDHPDIAASLVDLGILLKDLGRERHAEARRCQEEALRILARTHAPDDVVFARPTQALGHLERRAGHPAAAESLLHRALDLHRRALGAQHREVGNDLLWLGWYAMRRGHLDQARADLETSMRIFEQAQLPDKVSEARNFLANLLVLQGDLEQAANIVLDDWRSSAPLPDRPGLGLARLGGDRGSKAADLLLHAGQPQAAWKVFMASSGWSARLFGCLSHLEDADQADALLQSRRAVLASEGASTLPPDEVRARRLQATARWMLLEQEAARRCPCQPDELADLQQIQAALRPDQAIVGWVSAQWSPYGRTRRDVTWAYVIRSTGPVQWQHLSTNETVPESQAWNRSQRLLHKVIHRASVWPHRVEVDASLEALSRRVGNSWFEPLLASLDGVEQLLVVLDSSNDLPPLECLRSADNVPLLERYTVSYIPSASVVAQWTTQPPLARTPAQRRALIIGDPLFDPASPEEPEVAAVVAGHMDDSMQLVHNAALGPTALRNALDGDPQTLRLLPRLPYSRREARSVAACFRDPILWLGRQPTEQRLAHLVQSSAMQEFDTLHLATHALVDAQTPERSAIVLSPAPDPNLPPGLADGLLTMREIYLGWNLDADLVTLSGCQTGLASSSAGGYLGIAHAFLRAGARSLLVSQWKVDDIATALLMERFYKNLTGHAEAADVAMPKAQALGEAKKWLRSLTDASGRRPFAHPAYWAGFILVGDPR